MMRVFSERFAVGTTGFSNVGVPVRIRGEQRLLFARITNLLSDGDGLRMCWDWKGASSLKPCFKHYNVFKKGSDLARRKPGYVEIGCSQVSQLREWTAADLYATADLLAAADAQVNAGSMTKKRYKELEMSTGLNLNRTGLLMSPILRFCDRNTRELVPLSDSVAYHSGLSQRLGRLSFAIGIAVAQFASDSVAT